MTNNLLGKEQEHTERRLVLNEKFSPPRPSTAGAAFAARCFQRCAGGFSVIRLVSARSAGVQRRGPKLHLLRRW